jgi:hypothetical protein
MNSLSFWPFENVDTAGTWLTESGVKDALPVGYDELTLIEYLYRHAAVNNNPYHCVEDFFKGLTVDHPDDHEIDFSQQLQSAAKQEYQACCILQSFYQWAPQFIDQVITEYTAENEDNNLYIARLNTLVDAVRIQVEKSEPYQLFDVGLDFTPPSQPDEMVYSPSRTGQITAQSAWQYKCLEQVKVLITGSENMGLFTFCGNNRFLPWDMDDFIESVRKG